MLVSWAYFAVDVSSSTASPRRPAERLDPTRPWYVRVLDPTGLNYVFSVICVVIQINDVYDSLN